jgi:hypothetical protein
MFHLLWPEISIDAVTIGLFIILIIPWLSMIIQRAELPGGWKIEFRKLQNEQELQRSELDTLKFLAIHFISEDELKHLQKLERGDPFPFEHSDTTGFFENELRRLRSYGLVENYPGRGIGTMMREGGDVKDYFHISDLGRKYLRLREQAEAT